MEPLIQVVNVEIHNNPGLFLSPFQFQITFDCLSTAGLKEQEIEWSVTYVGNPNDINGDQILDTVAVGPVTHGRSTFILEAPPPNPSNIKSEDLLGVTVILLTCSYRQREFIRVGYYVYNHLSEVNGMPVQLAEGERPDSKLIYRIINASEPRVTRLEHPWDSDPSSFMYPAPGQEEQEPEPEVDELLDDQCEEDVSMDEDESQTESEEDLGDDEEAFLGSRSHANGSEGLTPVLVRG